MHKKTRNLIMLSVKLISITVMVCVLFAGGYVYYELKQAQLKVTELRFKKKNLLYFPARVESGAIIRAQHLKKYYQATSHHLTYELWLQDLIKEQSIKPIKNKLEVLQDVELPPMFENSCKRFRCLQYKVNFEQIPSSLWRGLLGVEDFRFLEHRGVDPISILRAIIVDIKAMKLVQGGSTLTQQLVKNLFLSNEKKFERKFREIIYAIYLERELTKEEIITAYFNEVFWGSFQGIYLKGIGAASMAYFGKRPMELTEYEAAILIGLLKGPSYYHPIRYPERLRERTNIVFERLKKVHLIRPSTTQWSEQEWINWQKKLNEEFKENSDQYLYSLYLMKNDQKNFWNSYEKFVFYQAVSKVQKFLRKRTKDLDIAIKHFALAKNCKDHECGESFSFYSKIERNKDIAINEERHQVGSILKPIIYEQYLNMGKKLTDKVSTTPITLDLISGKWTPKDASKVNEKEISLLKALQKSKNIPVIKLAKEVGFERLEKGLIEYFPELLTPLGQYPAQLLGSIELSLSQVGDAYIKFINQTCKNVNNGTYDFEQSILYQLSQADKTTISRVSTRTIQDMNIFGKTGTSNNGLDNWYVAYDGEQLYITWFGVDANRTDKKMLLSGASSAYRIFQEFILYRGKRISEVHCY